MPYENRPTSPFHPLPPNALESGRDSDRIEHFADVSKKTPRDFEAEEAFIANRLHMAKTLSSPDKASRDTVLSGLVRLLGSDAELKKPPTPGGAGYGMFYRSGFRNAFTTGTGITFSIICPTVPGGNVTGFLYLTSCNRASLGVEAFVSYRGQNDTRFKVFDWARPEQEHWQTNVPFSALGDYLQQASAHGQSYQVLIVKNLTWQVNPGTWCNSVSLLNKTRNAFDQVYSYTYSATQDAQKSGWVGSWGPIVETFQDTFTGTNPMGALDTCLTGCDQNGNCSPWKPLGPTDADVQHAVPSLQLIFLDPNYSWAVKS